MPLPPRAPPVDRWERNDIPRAVRNTATPRSPRAATTAVRLSAAAAAPAATRSARRSNAAAVAVAAAAAAAAWRLPPPPPPSLPTTPAPHHHEIPPPPHHGHCHHHKDVSVEPRPPHQQLHRPHRAVRCDSAVSYAFSGPPVTRTGSSTGSRYVTASSGGAPIQELFIREGAVHPQGNDDDQRGRPHGERRRATRRVLPPPPPPPMPLTRR